MWNFYVTRDYIKWYSRQIQGKKLKETYNMKILKTHIRMNQNWYSENKKITVNTKKQESHVGGREGKITHTAKNFFK